MQAPRNVPAPIHTDLSNNFAHDTMKRRVPEIVDNTLERNPGYSPAIRDALKSLRDEIQHDQPIRMLEPFAPDYQDWLPQVSALKDTSWHNTVWFFAETYFYRRLLEAVRWWETGQDPFLPNKEEEYASAAHWTLLEQALSRRGSLEELLHQAFHWALWGNRIDLSFPDSVAHGTQVNDDDLLADDTEAVVNHLLSHEGPVHIITDNAGSELTMDLTLVDLLLRQNIPVHMHVKMHPTFVSDAIRDDLWRFFDMLEQRAGIYAAMSGRLREAFQQRRLSILPDGFWNSSYFLWQMPPHLEAAFRPARLVIVKGDANYRRILGDAIWPAETPFQQALAYFPAPIVALRTLKSDPLVGLQAGEADQLGRIDPRWRLNGKRGVIQFKP